MRLERYFRSFEAGTMPDHAYGQRIEQPTERLAGLEARRQELAVRTRGDRRRRPARQGLLQALVHQIRVASREEIYPTFNLPAVR